MRDRRESARDKVMYGGVAEIGDHGATRECIVRNISDSGANIEFSNEDLRRLVKSRSMALWRRLGKI